MIGYNPKDLKGKVFNPALNDWQLFEEAPAELVFRHRIALVPLQAAEILGLLNGTLKVDPDGPQLPKDAELYLFADDDALNLQKENKGVYLGVRALTFQPVDEGSQIPILEMRFIPC